MDQMKDYKQLIKELPSKSVVFAFGRFNPPTIGHELLVKAVKKLAQQKKADHVIYASKSQDAKKNPLSVDKKVSYLKLMFKGTNFAAANEEVRTFIEAAKQLNKKYKNIVMVAGSDRVPEFKRLLNTYNGKEFNFDTIEVISAGERDPDADDATGMSASKMRAIAVKGNYAEFKKGLPSTVREIDGKRLMNDIRDGMGLEPIKEQIVLVKDQIREQYFRGEIFNEGDIVESAGQKYTIVKRGSNHLLLKESTGKLVSKWIQDVKPTEEKQMNEELTDKTLKANDKIKVARVIASMLGIENAETSSNPENLINMALRKMKTKALNAESLSILDRMLNLATQVGIKYDTSLKPAKLKEGVVQPNGTDKIDTKTSEPMNSDNKSSDVKVKKGMITFFNYAKAQKIKEQAISVADNKKNNQSDHDYEQQIKVSGIDRSTVGHALSHPDEPANLRRRKVKYHLGEEVKENPAAKELAKANLAAKHAKEKESLASKHDQEKEQIKEAEYTGKGAGKPGWMLRADPKLAMALKKAKERRKFVAGTPSKEYLDKTKTNEETITEGAYEKSEENKRSADSAKKQGDMFAHHMHMADHHDNLAQHHSEKGRQNVADSHAAKSEEHHDKAMKLKEEVESIDESTHVEFRLDHRDKVSGDHKPTFAAHDAKVSDTTDKATYVKVPSHKADSFKSAMKSKHGVRVELEEAKKKPLVGVVATDKPVDPFFEDMDEYDQTVDVSDPHTQIETSQEDDISDEEIEAMLGHLSDEEIMDEYDEDELALVDDETGEEIPKSDEEDALDEQAIMEVLSRVERMKAKFRIRRTKAKRERATKIALKRYSTTATINKRSRRLAIKLMKKRLLRGRDPAKVSVGEKERIERTLQKRKAIIGRLATRLAPRVRKVEKARMSHSKFTQSSQPPSF
jgi:nicotinic acid mononucleotide adenylyltransferase